MRDEPIARPDDGPITKLSYDFVESLEPDDWELVEEAVRASVGRAATPGAMTRLYEDLKRATDGTTTAASSLVYIVGWREADAEEGEEDPLRELSEPAQQKILRLRRLYGERLRSFVWTYEEGPLDWQNIVFRVFWKKDEEGQQRSLVTFHLYRNDGAVFTIVTPPDSLMTMVKMMITRIQRLTELGPDEIDKDLLKSLASTFTNVDRDGE